MVRRSAFSSIRWLIALIHSRATGTAFLLLMRDHLGHHQTAPIHGRSTIGCGELGNERAEIRSERINGISQVKATRGEVVHQIADGGEGAPALSIMGVLGIAACGRCYTEFIWVHKPCGLETASFIGRRKGPEGLDLLRLGFYMQKRWLEGTLAANG